MHAIRGFHTALFAAIVAALAPLAAAQKVYWTDWFNGGTGPNGLIQSLPLSGSGTPTPMWTPQSHDVTIDAPNQVLYWTENSPTTGYVKKGNADGSGVPTIAAAQAGSAWRVGYVKDNANVEWVYWSDDYNGGLMYRANLSNGVSVPLLVTTHGGFAIDKRPTSQFLYTIDSVTGCVMKSGLNGTGTVALTSGPLDTGYDVQVGGMCIDAVYGRLWAIGVTTLSHPGPTQSWIKSVNLTSGSIQSFLTSPPWQGDPVGYITTASVDIAYDCVANEVFWTSQNAADKGTVRHADVVSGSWSVLYTYAGSFGSRFEGLAIDSNAACSKYQAFCPGDGTAAACPCGNVSTLGSGQGCASSLGVGALLAADGDSSVASDTLVLRCDLMPNGSALYFQGTAPQSGGFGAPFGDGLRCAGGSVVRLGLEMNSGGASSYPMLPGIELPISVQGAVNAGDTRYYQVWYRNAGAFCTPATFNLSNGMKVEWGA